MHVKPSQLATLLTATIAKHLPILIVGGPGVGKTSIVAQAAAAAGADLVISHPAVADPTDAKGFPWAEKGATSATFLPFGETARVLASKRDTVWFYDDLGQAPPAVQASYMPWLLARQVNGHRLPDHVTIIAATNRRTDRAGVSGVLEPVKSRFASIVELEPDVDEWAQWAVTQPFMPPEVIAFIRFRPELLYAFVPSADLINCPLPRTWENAGRLLGLGLPPAVEAVALAGAVGEGAAAEFLGFRELYRQLPTLEDILAHPDTAALPSNLAALCAVATGLAAKASVKTFGSIARYVDRLVTAGRGDFAALCVRDAARRAPAVQRTPEFVRLLAGELGKLITGTN